MNPATICAGLSLPGPGDSSVCPFGTSTTEVPSPPLTGPFHPSSHPLPPVLLRAMAKKQLWPSQLKRCPRHPSPHSTWPHMRTRPFLTWLPPSPPLLLTLLTLDNTKSFLVISGIIQAPHALQLFNLFSNLYLLPHHTSRQSWKISTLPAGFNSNAISLGPFSDLWELGLSLLFFSHREFCLKWNSL